MALVTIGAAVALATTGGASAVAAGFLGSSSTGGRFVAVSLPRPNGLSADSVLVAVVTARATAAASISAPAGWSLVRRDSGSLGPTSLTQALYVRVPGTAEPSTYSWLFESPTDVAAGIAVYSGVNRGAPVVASSGVALVRTKKLRAPSVSVTEPGTLVVAAFGATGPREVVPESDLSVRWRVTRTVVVGAAADSVAALSGSTGTRSAAAAGRQADVGIGQLVALSPAPTAPPVVPPTSQAPVATTPPAITGSTIVGQTLTVSSGDWSGSPTGYSYLWYSCDALGAACAAIGGAATSTYTLASTDATRTVRVVVTAVNAAGAGSATSASAGPVTLPPPPPPPPPGALPFGAFGLEPAQYGGMFTGAQETMSPTSIVKTLTALRTAGMRATISLAGMSKSNYQNADGTFNMDMWKSRVEAYKAVDFSEFVKDGTVLAHTMIDDLNEGNWGGKAISNAQIDEMARFSKQLWPEMLTAVRSRATKLVTPEYGGGGVPYDWQYLDTAWDQYSSRMGDAATQVAGEVASAKNQGLGLVVGLNVLTGGNGSSGIPGPESYSSDWAMSADELLQYGRALIGHAYACAFTMWTARYDYGSSSGGYAYFERAEIKAAMQELSSVAASRSAAPCHYH